MDTLSRWIWLFFQDQKKIDLMVIDLDSEQKQENITMEEKEEERRLLG